MASTYTTAVRLIAKANGVRLIHRHISRHGKFHQGPVVRPGDLVFFDNTWDYNNDGLVNDPLTHVGIVERQEQDGTIIFISRVAGAIERYRMNLALPHVHRTAEGRLLNDYIRRKDFDDPANTAYLTGELFAGFGSRPGYSLLPSRADQAVLRNRAILESSLYWAPCSFT